jgi:hypothetical protein
MPRSPTGLADVLLKPGAWEKFFGRLLSRFAV